MDTDENKEEYCVINVGRAGGKVKYTLLDKEDVQMARLYHLRAQLLVDPNGDGAKVVVLAFLRAMSTVLPVKPLLLHDLVWQAQRGDIPATHVVVHRNGVAVDNRLANLQLADISRVALAMDDLACALSSGAKQGGVYWTCVSQLPLGSLCENVPDSCFYRAHKVGAGVTSSESSVSSSVVVPISPYYECHYLPCTSLERRMLEFRMCGRCREVRYCCVACQELDWATHRLYCHPYALPPPAASQHWPSTPDCDAVETEVDDPDR